jgi:hypothetical protein
VIETELQGVLRHQAEGFTMSSVPPTAVLRRARTRVTATTAVGVLGVIAIGFLAMSSVQLLSVEDAPEPSKRVPRIVPVVGGPDGSIDEDSLPDNAVQLGSFQFEGRLWDFTTFTDAGNTCLHLSWSFAENETSHGSDECSGVPLPEVFLTRDIALLEPLTGLPPRGAEFIGFVSQRVDDLKIRYSDGSVQPVQIIRNYDGHQYHFFVAFAPAISAGDFVALDSNGRRVDLQAFEVTDDAPAPPTSLPTTDIDE